MRQAIGTTWIFSICLTFIILFTAYLAISINYANAFKMKSKIVSVIEENEGYRDDNSEMRENIIDYLVSHGYDASKTCQDSIQAEDGSYWRLADTGCIKIDSTNNKCNACIYKRNITDNKDNICTHKAYYKVITFFKFDIPTLNTLLTFDVGGESKLLYDFSSGLCK